MGVLHAWGIKNVDDIFGYYIVEAYTKEICILIPKNGDFGLVKPIFESTDVCCLKKRRFIDVCD